MDDCIFCKLLAGELEVSMVYQDHYCSAFMDIQPINVGHMLVVPNTHATDLAELKEEEGAQMFRVAQRLAKILRIGVPKCEGSTFFWRMARLRVRKSSTFIFMSFPGTWEMASG